MRLLRLFGLIAVLGLVGTSFAQDRVRIEYERFALALPSAIGLNVAVLVSENDAFDNVYPGGPNPGATTFLVNAEAPNSDVPEMNAAFIRFMDTTQLRRYPNLAAELEALEALLKERPNLQDYVTVPEAIAKPISLPYLYGIPANQILRSRARYLDTPYFSGVRYITNYRQDASPFINEDFWYTFQGLSVDGKTVISAVFRLTVEGFPGRGSFPNGYDVDAFAANYTDYLRESVSTLEALSPEGFAPSLPVLDSAVNAIVLRDGQRSDQPGELGVQDYGGLGGVEWVLTSLPDQSLPAEARITVRFSETGVTGNAGCNNYFSPFTFERATSGLTEGTLSITEPIGATRKSCGASTDALESAFFALLVQANGYAIAGDTLTIDTADGALVFRR